MRRILVAVALGLLCVFSAPPAGALPPSPVCPGEGGDLSVLGADGGHCDFLFTPDGIHVHCEWGGFTVGMMFEITSVSNCWRVYADGSKVPSPVAPQR